MFLYANWLTQQIANNVPLNEIVRRICSARRAERLRIRRPTSIRSNRHAEDGRERRPGLHGLFASNAPSATTIRSIAGRWTTTTASRRSLRRSAARRARTIARRSSSTRRRRSEASVDGRVMAPKFLGGPTPDVAGQGSPRGRWPSGWRRPTIRTSPPALPIASGQHFFGIGIVEPVDDIRVSNPASNRELVPSAWEISSPSTTTTSSSSSATFAIRRPTSARRCAIPSNESDDLQLRPLPGCGGSSRRSCLDCISQVTETKDKFRGLPLGARAVQIADGNTSTYFLTTFGRANATRSARATSRRSPRCRKRCI